MMIWAPRPANCPCGWRAYTLVWLIMRRVSSSALTRAWSAPLSVTASCGGFDQALGVLIFEVDGTAVAERPSGEVDPAPTGRSVMALWRSLVKTGA